MLLELERRKEVERMVEELKAELLGMQAERITAEQGPYFVELPGASIEEAQGLARSILSLTGGSSSDQPRRTPDFSLTTSPLALASDS